MKKIKSARIRPDYRGVICNRINGSTVTFSLFQPENVSVEFDGDIRVEELSYGSLFHIKVTFSEKYSFAPGQSVSDILFRNVRYYGDNPGMSLLIGYSPERKVSNITFEGLKINGRHIYDGMPAKPRWYMTTDMVPCYVGPNVENVVFR